MLPPTPHDPLFATYATVGIKGRHGQGLLRVYGLSRCGLGWDLERLEEVGVVRPGKKISAWGKASWLGRYEDHRRSMREGVQQSDGSGKEDWRRDDALLSP
jgi:hypothetical protein